MNREQRISSMRPRDIGIYDGDKLLAVIKNAKSYRDAFEKFRRENPHVLFEISARNIKGDTQN